MGFVLFLIGIYIAVGVGTELKLKQHEKLELSLEALKRVFTWPKIIL